MVKRKPAPAGRGRPRLARPATLAGRIGERVERLRKARGLTSHELAAAAGLGLSTVGVVESGRSAPTVDTLAALAGGLGITPAELMAGIDDWT